MILTWIVQDYIVFLYLLVSRSDGLDKMDSASKLPICYTGKGGQDCYCTSDFHIFGKSTFDLDAEITSPADYGTY